MAINPNLVMLVRNLQEIFRDKTTGAPLRNGVVYFWKDNERTIPKDVYTQTGTAGSYTYVALPNPLTLSSIGTFQNPNTQDDINVYYYPYNEDDTSIIEKYFIEVYSEGGKTTGVFQWSRAGWPPMSSQESVVQTFENFVPNPQFLVHNDVPATDTTDAGEIPSGQEVTLIAQGGWTFNRPSASTAKDIVLFDSIPYTVSPPGNPRFAGNFICEAASPGDTYKDLRLTFQDVNKFASTTQDYTFAFAGQVNSGSAINVSVILIKNYGTGGSAPDEINLGQITLESGYALQQVQAFPFGSNSGKTITADSTVQLAIRFPVNALYNVNLTDFILTPNDVQITTFPEVTDAQVKSQAIAGWVDLPAADGSDLYLTARLTKEGMTWDTSEIGDVVMETQTSVYDPTTFLHPDTNRMLANGTKYIRTNYSDLGIPFYRLFDKYWIAALQTPRYGTGADYFTCAFSGSGNELIIANNTLGTVTNTADGTPGTTFTFANIHEGDTGYFCKSYMVASNTFYIEDINPGAAGGYGAGTSGFTITGILGGLGSIKQVVSVQTIAATGLAGLYFTFVTYNAGVQTYYCWYKVDTVGSDPAPGGTGVLVNLNSTDTAAIVAQKTQLALNGFEVSSVKTVAGSAVPAGSNFTLSATGDNYYVWYKVSGAGTDPNIVNKIGIEVDILTGDTNTQVASKTQAAINRYSFASPDFRGLFLRGLNNSADIDPGVRYSMVPGVIGTDTLGTFELSQNLEHEHDYVEVSTGTGQIATGADTSLIFTTETTGSAGIAESRPVNANVNLAIKY